MEEINLIRPSDIGGNYGWPFREGTQTVTGSAPAGVINPVLQYRFGTGPMQGQAVVAGLVYTGPFTPLNGQYLFADEVTGSIWSVPYSSIQQGTTIEAGFTARNADLVPLAGAIDRPIAFGFYPAASYGGPILYILDADGELFRMRQR